MPFLPHLPKEAYEFSGGYPSVPARSLVWVDTVEHKGLSQDSDTPSLRHHAQPQRIILHSEELLVGIKAIRLDNRASANQN